MNQVKGWSWNYKEVWVWQCFETTPPPPPHSHNMNLMEEKHTVWEWHAYKKLIPCIYSIILNLWIHLCYNFSYQKWSLLTKGWSPPKIRHTKSYIHSYFFWCYNIHVSILWISKNFLKCFSGFFEMLGGHFIASRIYCSALIKPPALIRETFSL